MKMQKYQKVMPILRTIMLLITIFTIVRSSDIWGKENMVKSQILLTTQTGLALKPQVIGDTGDGFIIAGSDAHNAVALKTDKTGQIIWQHIVPVGQDDKAFFAQKHVGPEYSGATVMADTTMFLCGHMVGRPGTYLPALLTHLDPAGHVVSERTIIPAQHNQFGIARFTDCTRAGDYLAVIGYVEHFVAPGEEHAANPEGKSYWVALIDGDANIKWETQVPVTLKQGALIVGPVVVSKDSSFTFSATDNVDTEVVRISRKGDLSAKRYLSGSFILEKPVADDGQLQIVGRPKSADQASTPITILTLGDDLNDLKRLAASQEALFGIRAAYRLPDMSIALFGFGVRSDNSYFSQAKLFTPDLKSSETVDLDRRQIDDFGTLSAVVPENTGMFVTATSAVAKGAGNQGLSSAEQSESFSRGAVVDFVQFNQSMGR